MITTPADIAAAISILNAHARAYGCGKEAIYAYKKVAALIDARAGIAQARPVGVLAECRNCRGTGLFFSWYEGQSNERCRTCSATGKVYLRFVETTISGHRWHHPYIDAGLPILYAALGSPEINFDAGARDLINKYKDGRCERRPFESAGDWQPNAPGEKLEAERAAELLNLVEGWISTLGGADVPQTWPLDYARQCIKTYALELGCVGEACHYCGAGDIKTRFGTWSKHLRWSHPVCKDHADMPSTQWDKTPPLDALGPHARAWLARRPSEAIAA
ncbi:hypothetical protein ACRQ5Q_22445 [Bradyrhizobium sp. PMVTL-01]|uniref:hypothetical protein n=1 Tax=Bradyrhizobium sp. PMVTL-01 TaxID=3434999 RepID=UPI003F712B22